MIDRRAIMRARVLTIQVSAPPHTTASDHVTLVMANSRIVAHRLITTRIAAHRHSATKNTARIASRNAFLALILHAGMMCADTVARRVV
jgi:hypothetical protein